MFLNFWMSVFLALTASLHEKAAMEPWRLICIPRHGLRKDTAPYLGTEASASKNTPLTILPRLPGCRHPLYHLLYQLLYASGSQSYHQENQTIPSHSHHQPRSHSP
jgi:hypothetical protein